jgi:hypothetical protein
MNARTAGKIISIVTVETEDRPAAAAIAQPSCPKRAARGVKPVVVGVAAQHC